MQNTNRHIGWRKDKEREKEGEKKERGREKEREDTELRNVKNKNVTA